MKKVKTSIAILILVLMSITGVMKPVTVYADGEYYVGKDPYEGFNHALSITDTRTGGKVVGYCYNANKSWPGWKNYVTKIENATQDQFVQLDGNARDKEHLKEHILSVCYKGFPRDGIGLEKKYGLSKGTFRFITQLAVWYYTDSLGMKQSAIWNTYSWMVDANAEKAFNELISTPVTLPSNYTLDLYTGSSNIQNILSTTLPDNYVPPRTVEFSKKDDRLDGAELSGATLQVLNKTNGSIEAAWTTDGNTYKVDLFEGEYIFRETAAPNGYDNVSDIHFKVDKDGNVTITSNQNGDNTASAAANKLTVVDKKKPIQYKTLTVNKVWELYGRQDSEIPESVEVQLYEDGKEKGAPVKLEKSKNWSHTWTEIDPSKQYEVKEVTTSNDWVSRIEQGADGNFTIYNSMKPELTVEKIVRDEGQADKTREFDFNIQFTGEDGNPINNGIFDYVKENKDGTQVSAGNLQVQNGQVSFKLRHGQKIRIKGLPIKVTYRVEEVADANAAFKASYKTKNTKEQRDAPSVQITNEKTDNEVTVYNTFKDIVPTGIDLNNNYTVPGAFLMIAGSLLFGGIAVLRFRKRLK